MSIHNNLICFTVSTFPFPCPQRSHPGDVCCLATSSWITPPLPTPGNFARWSNTAESLRRAAASGRLERTKCSARFSTSREVLTSFAHACVNWWTWIYILMKFETTIREMHGVKNHEMWHKIDVNLWLVQVLVVPPICRPQIFTEARWQHQILSAAVPRGGFQPRSPTNRQKTTGDTFNWESCADLQVFFGSKLGLQNLHREDHLIIF